YNAGTSKNVFYVTWRDNTLPNHGNDWPRRLFHTVVDLSTVAAEGSTATSSESDIVQSVFGWGFEPRLARKVNGPLAGPGDALSYYHDYRTTNVQTFQLLEWNDGQCGAWAYFLIDALRAQGVWQPGLGENLITIAPSNEIVANWGIQRFLIKQWTYAPKLPN